MRSKISFILLCVFLSTSFVYGQDAATITAENVAQLTQISSLESNYLGEMAWSADSNWLAVGTSNDGVQVFEAGNLTNPALELAGGLDVLFNPNNQSLASAGSLWNIRSQEAHFTYGAVDYKLFSPDGQYLITAIRGKEQTDFAVYATSAGTELHSFTIESPVNFLNLVFSEDSSRFALLFENTNRRIEANSFIQVYESATGNRLAQFDLELPQIKFLTFSNGGLYLAAFNYEETYAPSPTKIIIWDIANQSPLHEFALENWYPVMSPDQKWFYVADFNFPYIVNLDTGNRITLDKGGDDVDLMNWNPIPRFSSDSRYMALQYSENMSDYYGSGIIIWEMGETVVDGIGGWQRVAAKISFSSTGINEDPSSFEFSPDSQRIAVSYVQSHQTIVWDIETNSIQQNIPAAGGIRFMPDSGDIRIGNNLWDSETETLLSNPITYATSIGFYAPITSPDGILTVSRSSDSIQIINTISGETTILPILDNYLGKVEYMNAESGIAVFKGTVLHVYNLNTQQEILSLNPAPYSFTMSDDGSILLAFYPSQSNSIEFAASIYHLRGDEQSPITVNVILQNSSFLDAAISPNNQYLLITEANSQDKPNRTALYSIETGETLASWSEAASVRGVNALFSPDSQFILTMATERLGDSQDELLIKIWELSALLNGETEARTTLGIASGFVYDYSVSFNPLANQLIVMKDYAELGDGPSVHNYILSFFDWDILLEHRGEIPSGDLNPLSLQGAHSPNFNPNGPLLLTRGTRWSQYEQSLEYLFLWDTEETSEPAQLFQDFIAGEFSPDATLLAGLSLDSQLTFWDMATLSTENSSPIFELDIPDAQDFAFSPDGKKLYVRTSYSVVILGLEE